MSATTNTRLTVIVTGIVQGVNFRRFTQRHASDLSVVGYVRNLADGSVEFVAEGAQNDLDQLLNHAKVGPWMAVVENVNAQWGTPTGEFYRFEIRY
jgi:acylphosphatase